MLALKRKKWFYYGNLLLLVTIAVCLVIGGLNLTAQRMAVIVPQLPAKAFSVELEEKQVSFDILGSEFQVRLPAFLGGSSPEK